MDQVMPTVTEGLVKLTDQIDFTKIQDNQEDRPEMGVDPLDFLIEHLSDKGNEIQEKINEVLRKNEEERQQRLREQSKTGDSEDSYSTPDISKDNYHLRP